MRTVAWMIVILFASLGLCHTYHLRQEATLTVQLQSIRDLLKQQTTSLPEGAWIDGAGVPHSPGEALQGGDSRIVLCDGEVVQWIP